MTQELKRVLIMAGGTGGHVFPGLATADYLRSLGVDVAWLGTATGIEARLVPEANYPLHLINISGLRGKGIKTLLQAPFKIISAICASRKVIKTFKPDVVIGMGGFVSGPGGFAAMLSGRPLVIHEQNAIAGFTNKLLARIAKKVMTGFPGVFPGMSKAVTVGNPVRASIESIPAPLARFDGERPKMRLLVLGGSLGAQALNKVVPEAISMLEEKDRPEIMHQTGEKHFAEVKNLYDSMKIQGNLAPFVKDMAEVYAWADVVLCRAGALTVAELCAAGVGAVFVPFPFAVDDHQTANAAFMVKNGAAICIQQSDLTPARLADIVREFARGKEKRVAMACSAYQLRQTHVVKKIYDICREVCN